MIMLAACVNTIIEKIKQEVVVNSECTLGLAQRTYDSNVRSFAEALLANPSIAEEASVTATDVAKFIKKVLDSLAPKLTYGTEVKIVVAILSNPQLLCMVKEERDRGELE